MTVQPPEPDEDNQDNDNNDYDEDDEDEDGIHYAESSFKFKDFSKRLPHPKIVRACGLALKQFDKNSVNTNHCIVKLLHRIAFDCKMYVMVFQLSIFRSFQKIFAVKDFPEHKELVKFATYIVRQFIKVSETNKKVFMEALFWKSSKECYDIETGYLDDEKSTASARAWSEEEEDELRRLFVEHQQSNNQEDPIDWITNNLIDNTKSRRQVIKKLKELCLLLDYKGKKKAVTGSRPPKTWSADEEANLQDLFEQYKEYDDPLSCIMDGLDVSRPKNRIVEKLLVMGLIQDKKELRKKRSGQGNKSRSQSDDSDNNSLDSHDSDSDDDIPTQGSSSSNDMAQTQKRAKKNVSSSHRKKSSGKRRSTGNAPISKERIAMFLINIVDSEMQEALEWLKESLSDAIEDYEVGNNEGIPLVPVMDYAETAMEKLEFQQMLKALGICEPFDEQEMYWRIPGHLTPDTIKNYCEMIQQALDKTLVIPAENPLILPVETHADESSDDEDVFNKLRELTKAKSPEIVVSEERGEVDTESVLVVDEDHDPEQDNSIFFQEVIENECMETTLEKKKSRIIPESDDENDNIRNESYLKSTEKKDQEEGEENDEAENSFSRNYFRKILETDSEEDIEETCEKDSKRIRSLSDSDSDKPAAKRGRVLDSDDE